MYAAGSGRCLLPSLIFRSVASAIKLGHDRILCCVCRNGLASLGFPAAVGSARTTPILIWKFAALFIFLFTLAAGVWNAPFKNFNSKVAAIPMMYIVLFAFIGCSIWTVVFSTSNARIYPIIYFRWLRPYYRLFNSDKWWIAVHNVLIYIGFTTVLSFRPRLPARRFHGSENPRWKACSAPSIFIPSRCPSSSPATSGPGS